LDISEVLQGNAVTLKRPFFYYQHKALRAVRLGKWKLHLAHSELDRTAEGKKWLPHIAPGDRGYFDKNVLYDLDNDIGETTDVASQHPAVVAELMSHLDYIRNDLGDNSGRGKNARSLIAKPAVSPKNEKQPSKTSSYKPNCEIFGPY
jgi:hypothetical protein